MSTHAAMISGVSGLQAISELEDLLADLLQQTIYRNPFWLELQKPSLTVPKTVLYGLVIENYHFLTREPYFDSPALGYQDSTAIRRLFNRFYIDEYGHDELLLRALETLGIVEQDLDATAPLAQTMALCNALAHWGASEPLFFFATLGVLEGSDGEIDTFVRACERYPLDPAFVAPVKAHAIINAKGGHGNLTRCIFAEVPYVDAEALRRMRKQMRVFIEMYDDFYRAILEHYGTTTTLLRRLDERRS